MLLSSLVLHLLRSTRRGEGEPETCSFVAHAQLRFAAVPSLPWLMVPSLSEGFFGVVAVMAASVGLLCAFCVLPLFSGL